MKEGLFIAFSALTIAFATGVVVAKNAVYGSFSLVLAFFSLAVIYVLWGSTLLAAVQVLIYAGAIVVLFVFVIMLLDLARAPYAATYGWLMVAIAGIAIWRLSLYLLRTLDRAKFFEVFPLPLPADTRSISLMLFNEYLWPFEVLTIFLLAMVVAVFALARATDRSGERK